MFCSTPSYIPILSLTLNTHRTSPKILELPVIVHQSKKIVEICSFNMFPNIVIIFWVIDFTIRPWHYTLLPQAYVRGVYRLIPKSTVTLKAS